MREVADFSINKQLGYKFKLVANRGLPFISFALTLNGFLAFLWNRLFLLISLVVGLLVKALRVILELGDTSRCGDTLFFRTFIFFDVGRSDLFLHAEPTEWLTAFKVFLLRILTFESFGTCILSLIKKYGILLEFLNVFSSIGDLDMFE